MDEQFCVSTPSEAVMSSNGVIRDCLIEVCGNELLADLILLEVHDFDIISGMDWLSRHYATIDCHNKNVVFEPPNLPSFSFTGTKIKPSIPIITTMKTRRMINKGCMAYLASIM